jgi:hypothetical protein
MLKVVRLANDFQNIVAQRSSWGYGSSYANSKEISQRFSCDFRDDMIALPMVLAGGAGLYPL